jgi:hypothetical protein
MIDPKVTLLGGVKSIEQILVPYEFQFQFRGEGKSSGGYFAWGEFTRDDRRIELHFRDSLGLVRYHVGDQSTSHEMYMRELGAWEQCRYPGFSDDPMAAFEDLAHDLAFAEDFLSGGAEVLRKAAAKDSNYVAEQMREQTAQDVGDARKLEALRARFHEHRYGDVLAIAAELTYPERMSEVEQQMVEMAKKRTGSDQRPTSSR